MSDNPTWEPTTEFCIRTNDRVLMQKWRLFSWNDDDADRPAGKYKYQWRQVPDKTPHDIFCENEDE